VNQLAKRIAEAQRAPCVSDGKDRLPLDISDGAGNAVASPLVPSLMDAPRAGRAGRGGLFECALLVCTLTSCSLTAGAPSTAAAPTTTEVLECSHDGVQNLVTAFFRAWNAGRADDVRVLLGSSFVIDDGIAMTRRQIRDDQILAGYIAERHAGGDHFDALRMEIPAKPNPATANATIAFQRSADGIRYSGNAKVVCVGDRISSVVMTSE
jgi:hypothetical protein